MSLLPLLVVPLALAQVSDPPEVDPDRPGESFRLEITTTAWFPRMLGTYAIGPDGTELDVETDTYMHDSETVFMGELEVATGPWRFRLTGEEFSTSGSGLLSSPAIVAGTNLPTGSDWSSEYEQWSLAGEVDLAIWRPFADEPFPWSSGSTNEGNRNSEGGYLVDLAICGRLGFRFQHVRQTFESSTAGLQVEERADWSGIVLGMIVGVGIDTRPILPFMRELAIESGVTVSPIVAGGSGWMYSVEATMRGYLTPNAALTFGFRLQGTNASADQYQRNGSIMGLVAGFTLRF